MDGLRRETETPEERDARFKSPQNKLYMFIEISIRKYFAGVYSLKEALWITCTH